MRGLIKSTVQVFRRLRLRLAGSAIAPPRRLEKRIDLRPGIAARNPGVIRIAAGAWIETGVVLHAFGGQIDIGRNVFLGPYSAIYGHGGVSIGDDVLVSMHCRILSSNHTIPPVGTIIRSQPDELKPTRIGHDVWLGAGVTILGGVTIGDGVVVGAGAVVTHDLPPGSIAHGVPAQVRDHREVPNKT